MRLFRTPMRETEILLKHHEISAKTIRRIHNIVKHYRISFLPRGRIAGKVVKGFSEPFFVLLTCIIIRSLCFLQLMLANPRFFLLPTLLDRINAPLRAAFASTNRLPVYLHKDRIRMGRGKHSQRDPTRTFWFVFKLKWVHGTVGENLLGFDRIAVNDKLNCYISGLINARPLGMPIRFVR